MTPEDAFAALMSKVCLTGVGTKSAIDGTSKLIDLSFDLKKPEGIDRALVWCEELKKRNLDAAESVLLHYFWANAWSDSLDLRDPHARQEWHWECPEFEGQILHLRLALSGVGFAQLPAERQCQILTNLGNTLNHFGRFAEATEYYDRALAISGAFPMALGNRGYCWEHYAAALYDRGHAAVMRRLAHGDLDTALRDPRLSEYARDQFAKSRDRISTLMGDSLSRKANLDDWPLGESSEEIEYRRWCLLHRLFLNPLNDLGAYAIAARDTVTTPNMHAPLGEGPIYQGFYNQLKQEFVTARYLYYDGTHGIKDVHFSDKGVLLYNTLDYPVYCFAAEKVKVAIRLAYSLLDKVAFLLNNYLELGIDQWRVSFKTFWYVNQERDRDLLPAIELRQSWPLRGLYWVSKDLYERDAPGFRSALEPDARELADIRNHLEHKYLKLHERDWVGRPSAEDRSAMGMADTLAYSVYRDDFEAKTLRLLKMARAALIYLALAIHAEERLRAKSRKPDAVIPGFPLDLWDDEWKR